VPVTFGHCFLFFLIFDFLFFTALDALPCPVSNFPFVAKDRNFPFVAKDRRRKLHREWVLKARSYVHVVGSV
jgi:hypothetical protein